VVVNVFFESRSELSDMVVLGVVLALQEREESHPKVALTYIRAQAEWRAMVERLAWG
jgi:hypothetical protein